MPPYFWWHSQDPMGPIQGSLVLVVNSTGFKGFHSSLGVGESTMMGEGGHVHRGSTWFRVKMCCIPILLFEAEHASFAPSILSAYENETEETHPLNNPPIHVWLNRFCSHFTPTSTMAENRPLHGFSITRRPSLSRSDLCPVSHHHGAHPSSCMRLLVTHPLRSTQTTWPQRRLRLSLSE